MNFLLKMRVKISLMGGYKTGVPLFVETLGGWHGEKNRIVISANSTGPHLTKTKGLGKNVIVHKMCFPIQDSAVLTHWAFMKILGSRKVKPSDTWLLLKCSSGLPLTCEQPLQGRVVKSLMKRMTYHKCAIFLETFLNFLLQCLINECNWVFKDCGQCPHHTMKHYLPRLLWSFQKIGILFFLWYVYLYVNTCTLCMYSWRPGECMLSSGTVATEVVSSLFWGLEEEYNS